MSVSPQSLEGGAPAGQAGDMSKAATGAKYALFLLFAINLLNFFDRQLLGALGEPVRHEFGLSDTALGFLGTIFTIIYAFVGLPLGAISDRSDGSHRFRAELRADVHRAPRGRHWRGHLRTCRAIVDRRSVPAEPAVQS